MGRLINHEYETHIEICEEEIPITVCFDYQPYEPMTRHYPGCDEAVDIGYVHITGDEDAAISLLPEVERLMEEEILEEIEEYRRDAELMAVY